MEKWLPGMLNNNHSLKDYLYACVLESIEWSVSILIYFLVYFAATTIQI